MNLENYYYYFTSVLPLRFCNDLVKYANSLKEEKALTGGQQKYLQNPSDFTDADIQRFNKARDSNLVWLNEPWILKEIQPYIQQANIQAKWNFDWDYTEDSQFTKYKLNQHYDWHCDSWPQPYDCPENLNKHNKIRKLSAVCTLSDKSEYEGGELEFQFRGGDDPTPTQVCKEIMPKGSIVVFPSFVWHRVKPVLSGERYSLVIWNLGHPYK